VSLFVAVSPADKRPALVFSLAGSVRRQSLAAILASVSRACLEECGLGGDGKRGVRWVDRTGPIPAPHAESDVIVVSWLGLSHDESAGVAPEPAARSVRIGTVVGCDDGQRAGDTAG